jgi:Zn-dependent peptidase ImmA (M78 family)/transcriptional regulator with XRE-family HTH domain
MPHEYAPITPSVLRWAREAAGYSVEDAARKLNVKPDRVRAWEDGSAGVTPGRLDSLACLYKRPTIVFYLQEPPDEAQRAIPDYRSVQGADPSLIYQVRHARERREVALDLLQELGQTPVELTFECSVSDDPETVGGRLRKLLGFSADEQLRWKHDGGTDALNHWKEAAEARGVLVFQASTRQIPNARGFSLFDTPLPVTLLRSSDTANGRCFTLMHELTHLGLRKAGICDFHDDGIELFCNRVASAALMPRAALDSSGALSLNERNWSDAEAARVARCLSVSEHALALRLTALGKISWSFYSARRARYERLITQAKARGGDESGFVPPSRMAVVRNGREFSRLVLDAYHRGNITAHRASQYLDIGFQHLREIEADLARYGARVA